MCCIESFGRLKCLATGLDAFLSSFTTSRRCSRNRWPSRLPVSPIDNFLVRIAFQTGEQPGTFTCKCARARCKTCPFICNVEKLTGPKRSIKITDHFTCTSANVIYCITCTLCKKLYIGETGRRLGDRFREHLRDVIGYLSRQDLAILPTLYCPLYPARKISLKAI